MGAQAARYTMAFVPNQPSVTLPPFASAYKLPYYVISGKTHDLLLPRRSDPKTGTAPHRYNTYSESARCRQLHSPVKVPRVARSISVAGTHDVATPQSTHDIEQVLVKCCVPTQELLDRCWNQHWVNILTSFLLALAQCWVQSLK